MRECPVCHNFYPEEQFIEGMCHKCFGAFYGPYIDDYYEYIQENFHKLYRGNVLSSDWEEAFGVSV